MTIKRFDQYLNENITDEMFEALVLDYLKEHFTDGEDIVLFKRSELDELPRKIRYLLEHDDIREQIAIAGCEKAMREHTWRRRAEQLLEMLHA